jgi:hypothetical protein
LKREDEVQPNVLEDFGRRHGDDSGGRRLSHGNPTSQACRFDFR